jgi:hypothetical protein
MFKIFLPPPPPPLLSPPPKKNLYPLRDNVEKNGRARQTTDEDTIGRMRIACWITTATDKHSEY